MVGDKFVEIDPMSVTVLKDNFKKEASRLLCAEFPIDGELYCLDAPKKIDERIIRCQAGSTYCWPNSD